MLSATVVDRLQQGPRTNYDRELIAQGVGNMACGILGAIPLTGVIIRSAANVAAGAHTRLSSILHGLWLLVFVAFLPGLLKLIPTASLAAILVVAVFKLVNVKALREPLRGNNTYSGFLLEDYSDKLGEDGQAKLNTSQKLTRRMEALTESLLMYSRVGRTELAVQDTNLNETLEDIVETLEIRQRELGVEIRQPQPLPTIRCDGVRAGKVFRNLITNAMKYNDKPQKWIEIGCEPEPVNCTNGGVMVFHVRDNGIGIRENASRLGVPYLQTSARPR